MVVRPALLAFPLLLCCCACQHARPDRPAPPPPAPLLRLVFGGDVMLSRHVARLARLHKDPARPFREIAPLLAAADIAFCNLESPFSDRGGPVEQGMIFKAEPEMIEGLLLAGVDVVSTANNHARDRGVRGLEYTLGLLSRHGIAAVGTGLSAEAVRQGAVLERRGVRFGFLAYTYDQSNGNHPKHDPRIAMLDIPQMRRDIAGLAARADVIVVSMHAGREYDPEPDASQVAFARAAIDAGARLVIGHHPHVVQPVESYRDGLIFYSLGNLVFDQFHRDDTQRGLLAAVTLLGARIEAYSSWPIDLRQAQPRLFPPSP